MGFNYLMVLVLLFALLNPMECLSIRKEVRTLGKSIKNAVKKVGIAIKEDVKCLVLYRVVCPQFHGPTKTAIDAGAGGNGSLAVGANVLVGAYPCRVQRTNCKRSVENDMAVLAFSDDLSDYDMNGNKRIEYEEFVSTVMRSVGLADPLELRGPFNFADLNRDGELNIKEFNGAPFLFAHANSHQFIKDDSVETTHPLEVSIAA
ncbi:uncharacterized protein LOC128239054 [Mya arenaria]|uniref:uncharacterized protein LOC128239054 n=1 Tax=Mya arenaria TaxID=6604 RepID=UPI0022E93114|nr:uncharacterized protein LOC128239054 [Mya arenaria]